MSRALAMLQGEMDLSLMFPLLQIKLNFILCECNQQ
jgi:hypothetical protein